MTYISVSLRRFDPITFEKHNHYPMKRRSTFTAIGGYQPFLFAIGMYLVALFFSIFICSAIFYAINPKRTIVKDDNGAAQKTAMLSTPKPVILTLTGK